jgi:YggT family protein
VTAAIPMLVVAVRYLFIAYEILVIVRVVLSYLRTPSYTSPWLRLWVFVYAVTEPLLSPIRRALARYTRGSPLDFSPLVLILLLSVAERLIIRLLLSIP